MTHQVFADYLVTMLGGEPELGYLILDDVLCAKVLPLHLRRWQCERGRQSQRLSNKPDKIVYHTEQADTSDLTDEQWQLIKPWLPLDKNARVVHLNSSCVRWSTPLIGGETDATRSKKAPTT